MAAIGRTYPARAGARCAAYHRGHDHLARRARVGGRRGGCDPVHLVAVRPVDALHDHADRRAGAQPPLRLDGGLVHPRRHPRRGHARARRRRCWPPGSARSTSARRRPSAPPRCSPRSRIASDLNLGGFRLPSHTRQVNESWLDQFRSWVYGGGFGWQIGVGLATYVTTAAVYLMIAMARPHRRSARSRSLLMTGFGLVRGLAVLLGRRLTTPERLLRPAPPARGAAAHRPAGHRARAGRRARHRRRRRVGPGPGDRARRRRPRRRRSPAGPARPPARRRRARLTGSSGHQNQGGGSSSSRSSSVTSRYHMSAQSTQR